MEMGLNNGNQEKKTRENRVKAVECSSKSNDSIVATITYELLTIVY